MTRTLSAKAEDIIQQKPDFWEYALTGTLIHDWVSPTAERYKDLRRRLYLPMKSVLAADNFFPWSSAQFENLSQQIEILKTLVDEEMGRSWGPPGQPGSVDDIKRVCTYIADSCDNLLKWEEDVRSVSTDDMFEEIVGLLPDAAGIHIAEIMKIPAFIDDMLASGPKGDYKFDVVLALPDGWEDRFQAALQRLTARLGVAD